LKKYLKYLFALFSFGLTLISMQSGFYFYTILFGLSTAILATGVFEILRLATLLFLSLNLETPKKAVAAVLYVMVAFICAFAATSSFHARIIQSHQRDILPYTTEIEGRVGIVQQKYAQIYAKKIDVIEEKIDICKKKTILLPESTYWPKRLAQVLEDRHAAVQERDSLISSVPESHIDAWVKRHAAITDVTFEALPLSKYGAAAITAAVQELWDIGELSVKKLMALAIVLAIEIGIILLAVFARFYAKEAATRTQEEMFSAAEAVKKEENVAGSSLKALTSTTESSQREQHSSHINHDQRDEIFEGSASKAEEYPSNEQLLSKDNGRHKKPDIVQEETEISQEDTPVEVRSPVENTIAREEPRGIAEPSDEKIPMEVEVEEDHDIVEESQGSEELPQQERGADMKNDINHKIMKRLQFEFREDDIERFLKIAIPFFKENGKLIPANKLSRRLQLIRRVINKEFSKEELEVFFHQGLELSVLS
jgi:hypothetical protein